MAGLVTGIDAMQSALAPKKQYTKVNWFKIRDGQSLDVRFLQELDPAASGYDEAYGLAVIATVMSPNTEDGWKYRYVMLEEDEALIRATRDWQFKTRIYINVLVDGEVQVWDAPKSVAKNLLEYASEFGSITDRNYKVKRTGTGRDTQYIFMPKGETDFPDVDAERIFDAQTDVLRELTVDEVNRFSDVPVDSEDDEDWALGD